MTHPTGLELSMHADNANAAEDASDVAQHIRSCTRCQARLAAARDEIRLITSALRTETPQASGEVVVPKFTQPSSLRGFALANLATGLVIWTAQFLWKTLFGELIVNATTWVTSIYLPDTYALASAAALYLIEEGTDMFDQYFGFAVLSLSTVTLAWIVLKYRKARAVMGVGLLMLTLGTLVAPVPANALEIRRDEDVVTITKSETINDTLLVAADTVLIEGVVTGDVVAVGRRVNVSGSVQGNLLGFAESVTVRGEVGGFVSGCCVLVRSAQSDGGWRPVGCGGKRRH